MNTNIDSKIAWAVIVVFSIGVSIASYVYVYVQPVSQSVSVVSNNQSPVTTTNVAQPTAGTISSVSPTGITITGPDGTSRTLAITPSTIVESVVAAGEVGKNVADLTVGTSVFVIPLASDPNIVRSINIPPPLPPKPAADTTTISGKISAVSTDSMMLTLSNTGSKKVLVTPQTNILSNVSGGQKGKGLSELKGSQVQVIGTTSNGSVTAQIILVIQ